MSEGSPRQRVLIVGSGFAGLCMAIKLRQAGIDDFTVLEQADRLGGTWRDNTYPGAACDVPSHLYSFSFAPNPEWTRAYPPQEEIRAYMERCADAFGIRPHLRFGARVVAARFHEDEGLWRVRIESGEELTARALVVACGGLSRPAYPSIAGLDDFTGPAFHTSRWRHDVSLRGRRVGVIGTGASAIQVVPEVAREAARLHVFQRTPPWILPKPDRAIGPVERALYRRVPALQRLQRVSLYWQLEARVVPFVLWPRVMQLAEGGARRFLARSVPSPELRAKLTPDYRMGCKRILISNDYYPALQQPNVELVTDAIARVTPGGVVTGDGRERGLDALILATGFNAADDAAPFEVRGRGGRLLDQAWADGAEAYLGTVVSGFPNLFLLVGPNTGLGHSSMIFMIESQVQYVMSCLRALRRRGLRFLDVRADVQAGFNHRLQQRLARTVWSAGCLSWYQNRAGKNTTLWPGFTWVFALRTRRADLREFEAAPERQDRPTPAEAPATA